MSNTDKNRTIAKSNQLDFLSGGGEMGERIRNFDWSSTPLGEPETWDQPLKTCVRIILMLAGEEDRKRAEALTGIAEQKEHANRLEEMNTSQKHFDITDLNELVKEVEQELHDKIAATRTRIECDTLPYVRIIPFQFKQLFTNLITNSIKFARPGIPPHIKIECILAGGETIRNPAADADKNYWHISIADNGAGFDPQFNEQIFRLFQRLHGRMEHEGTGIGLAIAKKVVENHNGIITAEGKENEGATIHIYLPL
jgi:signal transduction histidine kinase